MDAKHTTGPWRVTIYGGFDAPRVWSDDGSIALIQHHESGPQEGEANARLIAAAPELLDALESFLRAPSVGSGGPGSSTIVVQEFNLRAARAAIAKAKGG